MTTETPSDVSEIPPLVKLKRFLHYGNVQGVYVPGSRWDLAYYTPEIVEPIRNVLKSLDSPTIMETIKHVYRQKNSPYPELVPFVVAECLRIPELKKAALALAEFICVSPESFILLFAFGFKLLPKIGTGRAIRRFIRTWYLKKDDIDLAVAVTKYTSFRGWTHKDLIFLARVKSEDPGKKAILIYVTYGLNKAIAECGENEKAAEVIEYLLTVDSFRKCVAVGKAAETIETYQLSIEHLNYKLLKQKQVWCSLLRQLPLKTLLKNFQLISRSGMFRERRTWDDDFQLAIVDALTSWPAITSGVHPSEVFVELLTYRFLPSFKLSKKLRNGEAAPGRAPAISPTIVSGFDQLIEAMLKNLKPSNLKFLISVDPSGLSKRKCRYLNFADAHYAAAIIIICLYKGDEGVTIVSPVDYGRFVNIDRIKTLPLSDVPANIISATTPEKPLPAAYWAQPQCSAATLFDWAIENNADVDVFVIIDVCIVPDKCLENFRSYKNKTGNTNAKLILFSLCQPFLNESTINETDVFAVSGFDRYAMKLVSSFLVNAF